MGTAKARLLVSLVVITLAAPAQQYPFSPRMVIAHKMLYTLQHDSLQVLTQQELDKTPKQAAALYLRASVRVLDLLLNYQYEQYKQQIPELEKVADQLALLPEDNPFAKHLQSELLLGIAALHYRYDHAMNAGLVVLKAHKLLRKNLTEFPDFAPTRLLCGIFYAEVATLPDSYQFIAGLFGFQADAQGGFAMMREAYADLAAHPQLHFLTRQYGIMYAYAHFQLTGSDEVSPLSLGMKVEESALTIYVQAQIWLNHGYKRQAYALMRQMPQGEKYRVLPYMLYHTGKLAMAFERKEARPFLEFFIAQDREQSYVKSACRYLCWYYLLQGQKDSAQLMQQRALRWGNALADEDRQALSQMQHPQNPSLVHAELLFDAGAYAEAIALLEQREAKEPFVQAREQLQYFYRLARCHHEAGQGERAILFYKKCLQTLPDQSSLMHANSALYTGLLLREAQPEQARAFFNRCLQYQDYPYDDSVQQRAKNELSNLP